jgi:predicted PurR-regulated permease PerM
LVGLDYGFLIGILGGVLSFIPYVGSMIVFMFGLGVALVQGWPDFHLLAMTLGVVVAGQFLEAYVVSPKLVGQSVGLHPVWLMFALLAFGELFGFVGLIIAVPAAAAIGVIVRRLLALYLAGPLFRGKATGEKAPG